MGLSHLVIQSAQQGAAKLFMGTEFRKAAGFVIHHYANYAARGRFGPGGLCSLNTGADYIGG